MLINKIENPYLRDKFLEISTARVLVLNPATKQEIFMCEMSADELVQKVDEEKIKADIDNHVVAVINKNKDLSFKATEVVTRKELQLAKLQAKMETGKIKAWHFPRNYEVRDGFKIILDQIPFESAEVNVYNDTTKKRIDATEYTITGREIEFKATSGVSVGENVYVTSFQFELNADYADIGTDNIPTVVSLIIMKPVFDTNDTISFYKQYFFPKCKMDGNLTLKGETEKKNNPEDTNFTIMKSDNYNYLGRMMYIPSTEIDDVDEPLITPISDLVALPTGTDVDFTFSAVGNNATKVVLQYKLSTDLTYTDAIVGTTGIYLTTALDKTSTSAILKGLTTGGSYDARVMYMVDGVPFRSNVVTFTNTASSPVPISNLVATSSGVGIVDLTFASSPSSTNIDVKYKLSSASSWSTVSVATTGTGVRMATAIAPTDTTAQVINLTSGSAYDFKLAVTGGTTAGDSNLQTGIVVA